MDGSTLKRSLHAVETCDLAEHRYMDLHDGKDMPYTRVGSNHRMDSLCIGLMPRRTGQFIAANTFEEANVTYCSQASPSPAFVGKLRMSDRFGDPLPVHGSRASIRPCITVGLMRSRLSHGVWKRLRFG